MHISCAIDRRIAVSLDFKTLITNHTQSLSIKIPSVFFLLYTDGLIYFVKGTGVGSDFGFPRVSTRKKYRWKKMNFTTDLPKKKPFVTYVVASAMKANMMENESDLPDYRMHAVIPYPSTDIKDKDATEYILCHVR